MIAAILASVSMCIAALVLCIRLWKTKNPARVARILAFIALACGIIHIACEFFPFEYKGGQGIDYIGQALIWGMFVTALLFATLASYISFAAVATIYAVKAVNAKDTRKKTWVTLIITWVCGLAIVSLVLTNVVSKKIRDKSIEVDVHEVTRFTDSDNEPAVLVVYELKNNTKSDIYYLGYVYDEVSQNGNELSRALLPEEMKSPDTELEHAAPGGTVLVKKAYKLKDPGAPVHILCRTYGGNVTYLDKTVTPV